MNNLSQKFKHESIMRRISVISIVAAAALVFTVFMAMMYKSGLIKLPGFVTSLFGQAGVNTVEVIPGDDGRIYDALMQKGTVDGVSVSRNITAADAAVFFAELIPSAEYTVFNRYTLFSDASSVTYRNKIWRQGVRYRIETYDNNDKLIKTVICDGESVYVTEHAGEEVSSHTFPVNDSFTLEQQAGMLSVEDVRAALDNTAADNTVEKPGETTGDVRDIGNVSVSLVRTVDSSVYRVEYDYTLFPLHEQLYISLEYGFIVHAETRETAANTLTYSLVTDFMQTGITGYPGVNIFSPD